MVALILSTNVAVARPDPGGADRVSGIDKRPQPFLDVDIPGPSYGDGSGVAGDTVGDSAHHGGAQKAVYVFAREELDYWQAELGRDLASGSFGENLTTVGLDVEALLINQRLNIGTAVVEVSIIRQPCRTFAAWLGERGWVKRFARHGRCGAYLRVVRPGRISPGDAVALVGRPEHDVDIRTAFLAALGDRDAAHDVVAARCLPSLYHERLARSLLLA